jgi:DNA-binding IclR family transcriptional regulator
MDETPYPGTQSVHRALSLLRAFNDRRPEWGLSDLSRAVGLNKTTTYRLLTALEQGGMLTKDPETEAYRLGPEAIALGGRALRANDLRSAGRPALEHLAQTSGETATLEILAGDEVLILDEVHGSRVLSIVGSLGSRWPAHATSTGRVLLAQLPAEQLDILLPAELEALTEHTITDPLNLKSELARVRKAGHAVVMEELEPGFVALGAPIRNHNAQVIAAVSLGGPRTRLSAKRQKELVEILVQAAGQISAQLGYQG